MSQLERKKEIAPPWGGGDIDPFSDKQQNPK